MRWNIRCDRESCKILEFWRELNNAWINRRWAHIDLQNLLESQKEKLLEKKKSLKAEQAVWSCPVKGLFIIYSDLSRHCERVPREQRQGNWTQVLLPHSLFLRNHRRPLAVHRSTANGCSLNPFFSFVFSYACFRTCPCSENFFRQKQSTSIFQRTFKGQSLHWPCTIHTGVVYGWFNLYIGMGLTIWKSKNEQFFPGYLTLNSVTKKWAS